MDQYDRARKEQHTSNKVFFLFGTACAVFLTWVVHVCVIALAVTVSEHGQFMTIASGGLCVLFLYRIKARIADRIGSADQTGRVGWREMLVGFDRPRRGQVCFWLGIITGICVYIDLEVSSAAIRQYFESIL